MARPRTRTRNSWSPAGYISDGGAIYLGSSFLTSDEVCQDAVGSRQQANHFALERLERKCNLMNGHYQYFGISLHVKDFADDVTRLENAGHILDGISYDPIGGATRVLARTNPNRTTLNLPVFFYELRELPSLIYDTARLFLSQGALERLTRYEVAGQSHGSGTYEDYVKGISNASLGVQFGWMPLVKDLTALTQLTQSVDKRVDELQGLMRNGGLGRTFQLGRTNQTRSAIVNLQTALMMMDGVKTKSTRSNTWGSVRWTPLVKLPKTDREQRRLALRLLTGTSINGVAQLENLWKAFPWSWLFDWCGNMGDFIGAHGNAIPLAYQNLCYMQKIVTTVALVPNSGRPEGVTGGGGTIRRVSLSRTPMTGPALTATLPFLNGRQMSILASLVGQRVK